MALTVEDGTGLANADAYISIADAETYFANFGRVTTTWNALDTAAKESKVRSATQHLDRYYGGGFSGFRADRDQSLEWPRRGAVDDNGWTIDSDAVPVVVQRAMAELALRAAASELLPDPASSSIGVTRTMDKVGELETERWYSAPIGSGDTDPVYRIVEELLATVSQGGSATVALERA